MTSEKTPFIYTILGGTTICSAFWSLALHDVQYVGTAAFMLFQGCLGCWSYMGFEMLVRKIRQALTFGAHRAVDFVEGKIASKKEARQKELLEAVKRAVFEAQARRDAASQGLKQPNQSSVVREINKAIFALKTEQLLLEYAALRRDVEGV